MRPNHWFYTFPLRFRSLFRRRQVEQELSDELQDHLERKTGEYIASGLTCEEARRKATREFGGLELSKEKCRDARRVRIIETALQDIRFGLRMLSKTLALPPSPFSLWASGSAPTPLSSAWSTPSCSGRCP
jgi:hypothetical protein